VKIKNFQAVYPFEGYVTERVPFQYSLDRLHRDGNLSREAFLDPSG